MQNEQEQTKSNAALREEAILEFWKENDIFKKSLEKEAPHGDFVFYEGPPTANAKPALHHLEARAFKDVLPRYKTMQGFHVNRRAGWDTHGLPVELQIEKKIGSQSKKDIEAYGIAKFNKECKDSVFTFIKDWEAFTDRIGYWVDKEKAYYTFNPSYMESLWSILAHVENRGLLYKDYKVLPWCPRCGTTLATHELALGYQDDKDLSVTAKFKVKGEENTYILAWTTTPWTLPGNVALAVGKDIEYTKFDGEDGNFYILATDLAHKILSSNTSQENVSAWIGKKTMKGSDLVGIEYEPLYPFLSEVIAGPEKEKMQNAYKVYAADFVTTTDGTGIVHTAVMYGADDFVLGTQVGLPKFHTVDEGGHFIKGTGFLEGRFVKDEEVAIDIIKDLAHRGLLFKKEKYEHSYPHCWRCKTPLIYYARDSWYIAMSKLHNELVEENKEINWEPSHIKEGRFGEWLDGIKDWAISRERYWGTPLPIWVASDGERLVVDSIATLKNHAQKTKNNYFVMRHGETEHNKLGLWNYGNQDGDPLTDTGREQVDTAGELLRDKKIDFIIASPFLRTLETAELIAAKLGLSKEGIKTDERLAEWRVGKDYDGKPLDDYFVVRNASSDRYNFKTVDGESYIDVISRSSLFLDEIEKEYEGKNILVISHGAVTRSLELLSRGIIFSTLFTTTRDYQNFANAEIRVLDFKMLPHNESGELDLHRPFIDDVVLEKDSKEFRRVKEVMDVWFDSGAMPFAQDHYPFEHGEKVLGLFGGKQHLSYPADFISEAIDQTRGWFYTLHAIGVLMEKGKAYKNVICLGHLLDKDGKKMSKSIGNIVEPFSQIDKFGVDAVRYWMYSVNQPGDSKNYDEKTVDEIVKKVFNLTNNVLSFYELYRDASLEKEIGKSSNVLDQWITARLNQTIVVCTENLDHYKLFEPTRAIRDFIDDMSTWYLRRSRDRIKEEASKPASAAGYGEARQTLYTILKTLAQLLAPFAPFTAEDIWQKLKTESDEESVHLSTWPKAIEMNTEQADLIHYMQEVRDICTEGNALRKKENIPVRQPLSKLEVVGYKLGDQYTELIKDELNVKDVIEGSETKLDTTITPELKLEGEYRELIRTIQDLRKEKGLAPSDMISLTLPEMYKEIADMFYEELKKTVSAKEVTSNGEEIIIS